MRRWAALGLALAAGCAHPFASFTDRLPLSTAAGQFELATGPANVAERPRVGVAVAHASLHLARWGGLRRPVTVYLVPSHQALEDAVRLHGYDWLRAWARYDEVLLQAPSSWPPPGASDFELNELLLHELTHCVMFQQAATTASWVEKAIPLWFREGMATFTAHQGYRMMSLEDLSRFLENNPGADPVRRADDYTKADSAVVYSAAHHAFTFLLRRGSEEKVKRLLTKMRTGRDFESAFLAVHGITADAFTREFLLYLKWRGYRGSGQRLK